MSDFLSRRAALKRLALLAGALGAGAAASAPDALAAELPHLTPDDPTAQALGYHDDASKVDAKDFPTYKPGQKCATCLQLQGQAGDPWRPCNLFPGRLVNANGWCRVWVAKS
jgi:hypothetical protein